jgi:hypothetical protein
MTARDALDLLAVSVPIWRPIVIALLLALVIVLLDVAASTSGGGTE